MRAILVAACMLVGGLWAQDACADIYSWVDADGVRHISNVNPPPGAQVFLRTPSTPPKASSEETLALKEEEILKEAMRRRAQERLQERQADLENRLAETEAKVEDAQRALERARERLAAARARHERDRRFAGPFVYGTRFVVTPRHDRFKRHESPHRKPLIGSVFLERPFQLGAITIPLFNAHDRFRKPHRRHAHEFRQRSAHGKPHPKRQRGGDRRH